MTYAVNSKIKAHEIYYLSENFVFLLKFILVPGIKYFYISNHLEPAYDQFYIRDSKFHFKNYLDEEL